MSGHRGETVDPSGVGMSRRTVDHPWSDLNCLDRSCPREHRYVDEGKATWRVHDDDWKRT